MPPPGAASEVYMALGAGAEAASVATAICEGALPAGNGEFGTAAVSVPSFGVVNPTIMPLGSVA